MKVKELFELFSPVIDPGIVVYDYKTNEKFTYNWLLGNCYMQECVEKFGDRTIMKDSVCFGEIGGEDSIDEFPYEFNLQDCCFHFDATVLGESPTLFVQGGEKADFERRKKAVLQKLEKGEIELIWQRNRNITT